MNAFPFVREGKIGAHVVGLASPVAESARVADARACLMSMLRCSCTSVDGMPRPPNHTVSLGFWSLELAEIQEDFPPASPRHCPARRVSISVAARR